MSDVIQCDICGDTYQLGGYNSKVGRLDVPFRYKVWKVLPWNRSKVGFVKQDVCRDCRGEFEAAVKYLKEEKQGDTDG